MITASQIQKKLFELNDKTAAGEVLVINIRQDGFEMAELTRSPFVITRIADLSFREEMMNVEELGGYFSQFVSEFDLVRKNYSSVYINWMSRHFTLLPESFYAPANAKELLAFNIGPIDGEQVLSGNAGNDTRLVYSIPALLKNQLDKLFPKHELRHAGDTSIRLFFSHFQLQAADVFIHLHPQSMELMIKKGKQLLLYNLFPVKSDEDVLYYLLFSIEQLRLDPAALKLAIAANRETGDELFKALKKYIRQVNFAVNDKMIERKEAFESIPHHYYFGLLNRLLCE